MLIVEVNPGCLKGTDQVMRLTIYQLAKARMTDKTHVSSYLLRDGIHDRGLDLEASQTDESHDPNDRDRGPQLHKLARRSTT